MGLEPDGPRKWCEELPLWKARVSGGMPMESLISVLMPVRNAEATLPLSLESIRRQRGVRWECVVVDDGSSDQSRDCIARTAQRDARVRYIEQPPLGIVAALNRGLAACRGELVARMDADDVMRGDRLLLQARALQLDSGLDGVGCHVRMFPTASLSPRRKAYEAWLNSIHDERAVVRDAYIECPLAHPTLMLRRSTLERYSYRDQGWPEDYDLVLRLLTEGRRLGVVARRLLAWRDSPTRLSRTSRDYRIERFTACKAEFLATTFLGGSAGYVLWGYGDTGRTLANALALHGKHPYAIVELHPGRIGQQIRRAPVIAPAELEALRARLGHPPIIASVAGGGPRSQIRSALEQLGYVELKDFVCAA